MRIRSSFQFVTAVTAAVSMGFVTPGLASSTGRAVGGAGEAPASSGGHSSTTPVNNHVFAGYSVHRRGGTWKVSAHIVVPTVRCAKATRRAIDASVGVRGQKRRSSSAGVFVGCHKGKPHYFIVLVVNGANHEYRRLVPEPGDRVALHVFQSPTSIVVSAIDKSRQGVRQTLHGAGTKGGNGPWVGDTAWDKPIPNELGVPNFGTLQFSNAKLNGKPFGAAGGSALVRWNRVKGTTTTQIKTSKLIGEKSFTTTFKHS